MTPKRRDHLTQVCHDNAIYLQAMVNAGKIIPRLDEIVKMYKIMEEIVKACPVKAG